MNKPNIQKELLSKAQDIMLETLIAVDKLCRLYNLRYWLDSGTLLGAVRHGGFIPWDDDLDICMPIEDFFQFMELAPKNLPKHMFVQTKRTEKNFNRYFIKVRNSRGVILEGFEYRKILQGRKIGYNTGIYIDIFPCIVIRREKLKLHKRLMFFIDRLWRIADIGFLIEALMSFADNLLHEGTWEGEDLIVVRSMRYKEEFSVPLDSVFPLREYKFEGRNFYGPKDYDTYLRVLYGDYMKLPPVNERRSHAYVIEIEE